MAWSPPSPAKAGPPSAPACSRYASGPVCRSLLADAVQIPVAAQEQPASKAGGACAGSALDSGRALGDDGLAQEPAAMRQRKTKRGIERIAYSPSGRLLVLRDGQNDVQVWD